MDTTTTPPEPAAWLGTMYLGTRVPDDRAAACLDTAYELGLRHWDTADNYAFWEPGGTGEDSERSIGRWLAARGSSVRDQVRIATKVGARPRPGSTGLDDVEGLSASAVRAALTGSLARLGVDRVDVLYAHVDDRSVPLAETVGTLAALVDEGLVGSIAGSNLSADRLSEALAVDAPHRYRMLQQRFSYLEPAPDADLSPHVLLDAGVERACEAAGVTAVGYSPLLSGAYTRDDVALPDGYRTPATDAALVALHDVAARYGLDRGQAVLAWMRQRGTPVVPVVGVSRPEHVRSAAGALATRLDRSDLEALDTARVAA